MSISHLLTEMILQARDYAKDYGHDYVTPEHILWVICGYDFFIELIDQLGGDCDQLRANLENYFAECFGEGTGHAEPIESFTLQQAFVLAGHQTVNSGKEQIEVVHMLGAMLEMPESYGVYYIAEEGIDPKELLFELCHLEDLETPIELDAPAMFHKEKLRTESKDTEELSYLVNLTEKAKNHKDPLIGRESILERTVQVLCRRYKNNPIHIGEPGVGKTAITLGLAKRIVSGEVPETLKGAEIFALDLGGMLAGTQYRGDFEKRLKKVFEKLAKHAKPILYIDEIHNIVGAGSSGGGSLDASNLIKPYLTEGNIRCIGATTFEEYKKYFEKDKSLVRRFQTIEIKEPTVQETITILEGIRESYEDYHGVKYTDEALIAAVKLSHQYINDKYLPDKAIDLIDDAGAYMVLNHCGKKTLEVTQHTIEDVLSRICHIPKQTIESNELGKIKRLENQLASRIFGQEQAVVEVVKSIKIWASGLGDSRKPIASMLFVGPTGVGKTEIAKCLADSLGVKLIRFDMSEYTEKHTASKLIGAPAGYVGYEEGGLLTDAIRKTPYCVLLLDEIEKAHSDIFNMLLQVMDYATLTDNQGKKADFRNVVLIMTSNAGASQIGKSLVGFGERVIEGNAITEEVKKVFTPEFRNRLSHTVVFNHINEEVSLQIANKELSQFREKLTEKQIKVTFAKNCVTAIAKQGVSKEFGAREIGRIVERQIKPLLVEALLGGELKAGMTCQVTYAKGNYALKIK
ncbi:MAG: AAA family ATPase [Cellulosilyticaceae bacterium]